MMRRALVSPTLMMITNVIETKTFFFLKIHRIGKHVISDNLGN